MLEPVIKHQVNVTNDKFGGNASLKKMQFVSELHDTYVIKAVKMATHTSESIRGL